MGFSKIPITGDLKPRGALLYQCSEVVERLRKLHFRSSDYPLFLKEAAALYNTTLTVAGLQAKSFPTVDLAGPYADSARVLAHLKSDPEIDRLGEDLMRSAEDLCLVTPVAAFHYQTNQRDYFSEQRLAELDYATHGRFSWLSDRPDEHRENWATALFETVAEQLRIGDLFETMPDPEKKAGGRASLAAWIEHKETWMRNAVAALPDYKARREDSAECRAIMQQLNPDYSPKTSLEHDTVLFDLLLEKGLRRTGATMLKLRNVNGDIKHTSESPFYEHHANFNDVDWVWLIKTTAAPQIYFQSARQPFLEFAIRREPENYGATLFAQEQQARTAARNQKAAMKREGELMAKAPSNAPSKSVMNTIRGWLKRT